MIHDFIHDFFSENEIQNIGIILYLDVYSHYIIRYGFELSKNNFKTNHSFYKICFLNKISKLKVKLIKILSM